MVDHGDQKRLVTLVGCDPTVVHTHATLCNVTPATLHWLAGLLEGEGSFLKGSPSCPRTPGVTVQMTDRDVIERVAKLFGVTYLTQQRGKWKTAYRTTLRGARAVKLMKRLRPLMGERRKGQIDRAVACYVPRYSTPWPSDAKLLELRSHLSWRQLAKKFKCAYPVVRRRVLRLQQQFMVPVAV